MIKGIVDELETLLSEAIKEINQYKLSIINLRIKKLKIEMENTNEK